MKKKVYLALPSKFPKEHEYALKHLVNFFTSGGFYLTAKFEWFDSNKMFHEDDFFDKDVRAIEEADFLIAEISYPSSGVGFQIAYALNKKKRVLALYKHELNESVSKFVKSASQNLLTIEKYDQRNLENLLKKYFSSTKPFALFKFNFIISEKIKEYLNWLSAKNKLSISEQLRKLVEKEIIDQDKEYLKHLHKAS